MNEVAICLFGTTGGVKAAISPDDFPLPDPLYQVVDASLPFIWGKEVYRWQAFEVSASKVGAKAVVHFFAVYTKIDDLGGPRDGAFAGAGVLIKDGHCDCELIASTLRRLLVYLIKEASNGRQFTTALPLQFPRLIATMQGAAEKLADSYVAGGVLRPRRRVAQKRAICTNEQWFLVSPAHFFEAARVSSSGNYTDLYFSVDRDFIQALSDYPDIAHVSPSSELLNTAAMAERLIAQTHQEYRKKLDEEREGRVAVESRYRELETTFQDSVSAAMQAAENGVKEELALLRELELRNRQSSDKLQASIDQYERDNAGLTRKLETQRRDAAKQLEVANAEIDKLERQLRALRNSENPHFERQHQNVDPDKLLKSTPRPTANWSFGLSVVSGVLVVLLISALTLVAFWLFNLQGNAKTSSLDKSYPPTVQPAPPTPSSSRTGGQDALPSSNQATQLDTDREHRLRFVEYVGLKTGKVFGRKIPKNTPVSLLEIKEEMISNCTNVNARKFLSALTVAELHQLLSAFNPRDQKFVLIAGASGEVYSENIDLDIAYRLPPECRLPK